MYCSHTNLKEVDYRQAKGYVANIQPAISKYNLRSDRLQSIGYRKYIYRQDRLYRYCYYGKNSRQAKGNPVDLQRAILDSYRIKIIKIKKYSVGSGMTSSKRWLIRAVERVDDNFPISESRNYDKHNLPKVSKISYERIDNKCIILTNDGEYELGVGLNSLLTAQDVSVIVHKINAFLTKIRRSQ